MKKSVKVALWIFSIITVVVLTVASSVLLLVNPNDYKSEISAIVAKQTGRVLTIPGNIAYSLLPRPGINVGKMLLGNTKAFAETTFAEIDAAEVTFKWLPLLANKIEFGHILLRGVSLKLVKNKQGETNWGDLIRSDASLAATANTAVTPAAETTAHFSSVDGLSIVQGAVLWDDQQTGQSLAVTDLQLTLDKLVLGQPVPLSLGFTLKQPMAALSHTVDIHAQVFIDHSLDSVAVNNLNMSTLSSGDTIPGGRLALTGVAKVLTYQQQQQAFTVDGLQVNAHNLTVSIACKGRFQSNHPDVQGAVKVAEFSLKSFLQQQGITPPVTQDPMVLDKAGAEFAFGVSGQLLTLSNLRVKLDQTTVNGSAEFQGFTQPAVTFTAEIDDVNVDRYLSPNADTPTPLLSSAMVIAATNQAIAPLEWLKKSQLNGTLFIRQLTMHELDLQGVSLKVQSNDGNIHTQQTIEQLYQGTYQGKASLSLRDNVPQLELDENIEHVQLKPVLTGYHSAIPLTGALTASAQLHGQGNSVVALKSSLAGNIHLLLEEVVLKGFNLQKLMDNLTSLVKGDVVPDAYKNEQSVFHDLSATATVKGGIIENHDLVSHARNVSVSGEGMIDLNTSQIAYKLKAGLLKATAPVLLKEWPLVLKVSGDLNNPSYTIDSIGYFLEHNKEALKAKKTELLKKLDKTLQKKLGMGASELLKKLF